MISLFPHQQEALQETKDFDNIAVYHDMGLGKTFTGSEDVLRAVNEYADALILLDQYDHQTLSKLEGSTPVYRITYEECVQMVVKELPHHCSWNF